MFISELAVGTTAANDGSFEIPRLPPGNHTVRFSYVGYLSRDTVLVAPHEDVMIQLVPEPTRIDEIVVEGSRLAPDLSRQAPVSTIEVTKLPVRRIPALLGERDLLRTVQHLPGVKMESDFTGGMYVRGGRNDQNLILLDGVPVYDPWHLFGLFSAFNSEAISEANLSKGVFPAPYGGRLSSVLDVGLVDGSTSEGAGHLSLSLASIQAAPRFRIDDRTRLLVAVRRTYLDPVFRVAGQMQSTRESDVRMRYNFLDANVKLTHVINERHRMEAALFVNSDWLRMSEEYSYQGRPSSRNEGRVGWRNVVASGRLYSTIGPWEFVNHLYITGYVSDNLASDRFYTYGLPLAAQTLDPTGEDRQEQSFRQRLLDLAYKGEGAAQVTGKVRLRAGVEIARHQFRSSSRFLESSWVASIDSEVTSSDRRDMLETSPVLASGFVAFDVGSRLISAYPGLRVEVYDLGRYSFLLPRLSIVLRTPTGLTFSVGAGRFAQYLHVLGNDKASLPTDRWFLAGPGSPPAHSSTVTAGASFERTAQKISLEGYYKRINGLRMFLPVQLSDAMGDDLPLFPLETSGGQGWAYGMEVFYQKTAGPLSGWAGYTLSWSYNRFDAINNGRTFPTRTDRRHDVQVALGYYLGRRWDAGLQFRRQSGNPTTFSTRAYLRNPDPLQVGEYSASDPIVIVETHNVRLPSYQRLDLSVTRSAVRLAGREAEVSFSVFNVFNRFNVFDAKSHPRIEEQGDGSILVRPRTSFLSQLPIIPMVSLRLDLTRRSPEERG